MQMLSERFRKIKQDRQNQHDKKDNGEKRDPDQAWFWTKEWQAAEREADADIRAGRVAKLSDASDLDKSHEELFGKDD